MPETDIKETTSTDQKTDDKSDENGTDWAAFTKELEDEGLKPAQVAERLKASRKWEQRAKDNSKAADELEKLKKQHMTENEKAVSEAKEAGRKEAGSEFAQQLAAAEIKAAIAGFVKDPAATVEDLNLAKFVTDKGEVDAEAVKAYAKKKQEETPDKGSADLKQGARRTADGGTDGNAWMRSL